MGHNVTVFRPYPFRLGQKIHIKESRRKGDWQVAAIGEHTVTLRCPISKKEFEWNKFCYLTEEKENTTWPQQD